MSLPACAMADGDGEHRQAPASASRRRFLLAGAASVVAVGVGGQLSVEYWRGPEAWAERVLRAHLPGIVIAEDSLALFFRDIRAKGFLGSSKLRVAVLLDDIVPVAAGLPSKVRQRIDRQERLVVTEFLLGSNFFRVEDPARETIRYVGRSPACGNPFARFDGLGDSPQTEADSARRHAITLATPAAGMSRTKQPTRGAR